MFGGLTYTSISYRSMGSIYSHSWSSGKRRRGSLTSTSSDRGRSCALRVSPMHIIGTWRPCCSQLELRKDETQCRMTLQRSEIRAEMRDIPWSPHPQDISPRKKRTLCRTVSSFFLGPQGLISHSCIKWAFIFSYDSFQLRSNIQKVQQNFEIREPTVSTVEFKCVV